MSTRKLDECPECGAQFSRGRLACPECGSDAETGWKDEEEIEYSSVEIPDYYEEEGASPQRVGHLFLIAAVLAVVAILVALVLR